MSDMSEEPEEPEELEELEDLPEMAWYVVHTYSGYENKAKLALEERINSLGLEDIFGQILVPEEQVVERTKTGKTRNVSRRFFPGYMLVQMAMDNRGYHVVRNTPKVTGFVGGSNTRTPPRVPEHEVRRILGQIEQGTVAPKPKLSFERGESIRVVEGPFANFNGTVDEVRPEKGKLRVMVSIFGRPTPVELDFMQVQKT
jgi:transcriptional antiterminator NusG